MLPPLRERREDIQRWLNILGKLRSAYRRGNMEFTPQALEALKEHAWPGNVRELDHVIERAVLMSSSNSVTAFDLALQSTPDWPSFGRLEEMSLEEAERLLI